MEFKTKQVLERILVGEPLRTEDAPHQAISNPVALAVFASDALSSVAYATQEILLVLVLAGAATYFLSVPIAFIIVMLLAVLTVSYRQTIFAYPGGGGAYIVSRDNLGEVPAMVAAAALLTDYILTVSVSVSSGVEQMASLFPPLGEYRMPLAVGLVILITLINMRGVKESGAVFAVPTYFFVGMMALLIVVGAVRYFTGNLNPVSGIEGHHVEHLEPLTVLLVLRAFSSGCTALTGVEAISNGIQAFREPRSRNAAKTLTAMSLILGVFFISVTLLSRAVNVVPSEVPTVISQIGSQVFEGSPLLYGMFIASATLILIMAANTSFADFPRLAALAANDGFLPRQLGKRGSRLVFSGGILTLAAAAIGLIIIFNARVTGLIPLYAIGVFMSFTLSQLGMVIRWRHVSKLKKGQTARMNHSTIRYDEGWKHKLVINAVGATLTFVVMIVFSISKFAQGAWIIVLLIPILVFFFWRVHMHYSNVARMLSIKKDAPMPQAHRLTTIVLVDDVHRGTIRVVEFAKSMSDDWFGVHVAYDDRKTEVVERKWAQLIGGELHIVPSPYRRLVDAVLDFVRSERAKVGQEGFVHVIMGQLVMDTPWARLLHANNAFGIMGQLQRIEGVIVSEVPYQLHTEDVEKYPENMMKEHEIELSGEGHGGEHHEHEQVGEFEN
ncbi:MAG TPA: APC family permease [Thermoflexales bacterium]|nr:APC family permease [Thermoflexales bacterium]HQW36156.1 APC family permease [Thermoflexales bacterium]HQZ21738.1 APC family permease [Thermoflexales bacterium]